MNLNIKNTEITADVRELAQLTGKSQTAVVGQAVKRELERVRRESNHGGNSHAAEILREIQRRLKGKTLPDHDELLYNESGLPK